jgi:DHA3 family macrolide efflux protein-like MFS transporter
MGVKPTSVLSIRRPSGMAGFRVVWIGQLVSVLASNMSGFALSIWMYQQTGSATAMSAMQVSFLLPFMIVTPIAGAMVDRYNRKLMMMVSDLASVLATMGILALQTGGQLQFWHLYLANILYGLGNAFQWPAYSAAISTMIPKEHYGRANGMMSLIETGPAVFSPVLAGALLPFLGLNWILTIDVITFFLAIGTLSIVHIPQPEKTVEGQVGKGGILKEAAFGFKYIFARPSLRAYLFIILSLNLAIGFSDAVTAPMILARTNQDSVTFGAVQTAGGVGGVLGGLIMGMWGGFKRRINTMLLGWPIFALIGCIGFGISCSPLAWIVTILIGRITFPITNGAAQSMWQVKVAPDVQGRVFAARRFIAWFTTPIMPLVAGGLADFVTEPLMHSQNALSKAMGWLVGGGAGAGMSLQFIFSGLLFLCVTLATLFNPKVLNMETILPDHDQMEKYSEAISG